MWILNSGVQKKYNVDGRIIEIPHGVSEHNRCRALENLITRHPDLSESDAPVQEQQIEEPIKKKQKRKTVQEAVEDKPVVSVADEDQN